MGIKKINQRGRALAHAGRTGRPPVLLRAGEVPARRCLPRRFDCLGERDSLRDQPQVRHAAHERLPGRRRLCDQHTALRRRRRCRRCRRSTTRSSRHSAWCAASPMPNTSVAMRTAVFHFLEIAARVGGAGTDKLIEDESRTQSVERVGQAGGRAPARRGVSLAAGPTGLRRAHGLSGAPGMAGHVGLRRAGDRLAHAKKHHVGMVVASPSTNGCSS